MADYTDHYYTPRLAFNDGRQIVGGRYRTVFDAMAEAESYSGVQGGVWYVGARGDADLEVIVYNADGSVEVGADVPEDDEDL